MAPYRPGLEVFVFFFYALVFSSFFSSPSAPRFGFGSCSHFEDSVDDFFPFDMSTVRPFLSRLAGHFDALAI